MQAWTTSNGPTVNRPADLQLVLSGWAFIPMHGELTVDVYEDSLSICGGAEFQPYREADVEHPDEWYDEVDVEGFLEDVAPYLEEDLVVQTIAHTKLRWPFGMGLAVVDAETGQVAVEDSDDWRERINQGRLHDNE